MNGKQAPKVSPLSMSLWQDPRDEFRWNWSVQRGSQLHKQGHSVSHEEALIQVNSAFTGMVNQFGMKK
jgi:hypothetical protein